MGERKQSSKNINLQKIVIQKKIFLFEIFSLSDQRVRAGSHAELSDPFALHQTAAHRPVHVRAALRGHAGLWRATKGGEKYLKKFFFSNVSFQYN